MRSTIDDFRSEGRVVKADQQDYIEIAPKVLCLHLNRLNYQNQRLVKHNNKV